MLNMFKRCLGESDHVSQSPDCGFTAGDRMHLQRRQRSRCLKLKRQTPTFCKPTARTYVRPDGICRQSSRKHQHACRDFGVLHATGSDEAAQAARIEAEEASQAEIAQLSRHAKWAAQAALEATGRIRELEATAAAQVVPHVPSCKLRYLWTS